jgi:hypothetical protein
LAKIRRCGWLAQVSEEPAPPVWASGEAMTYECPKSEITAQSLMFIETFFYWLQGERDLLSLDAKCADAMLAIKAEFELEKRNEKEQH